MLEANTQSASPQLLRGRTIEAVVDGRLAALEPDPESPGDPKVRKYRVTLIEEGWGNKKDRNYYPSETIVRAVERGLFEGVQAYADHPSEIEEQARPERSVRDLIGWYDNATWDRDPKTGKVRAQAQLNVLPDARWLAEKIDSVMKAGKPELLGLSILGGGDTEDALIDGEWGNRVKEFMGFDSIDVVTKAGAGGRFEEILEANRRVLAVKANRLMESGYGYGGALLSLCREYHCRRGPLDKVLKEAGVDEAPPPDYRMVGDILTAAANSERFDELVHSIVKAKDVLLGAGQTDLAEELNASLDFGRLEDLTSTAAAVAAQVYALADEQIKTSAITNQFPDRRTDDMAKKKSQEAIGKMPDPPDAAPGTGDPGEVTHDHSSDAGFCEACMEAGRTEERRRQAEARKAEEARRATEARRQAEEARRQSAEARREDAAAVAERRDEEAGYGLEQEVDGAAMPSPPAAAAPPPPPMREQAEEEEEEEEDMQEAGLGTDVADLIAKGKSGATADVKEAYRRLAARHRSLQKNNQALQEKVGRLSREYGKVKESERSKAVELAMRAKRDVAARKLKEATALPEDLKSFVFDDLMQCQQERQMDRVIKKYVVLCEARGGHAYDDTIDGVGSKDTTQLRESGGGRGGSDFESFIAANGVPIKAS